jgi:hypothetical protein
MDCQDALDTYDMLRDFGRDELRAFNSAASTLAVRCDITNKEARAILRAALVNRSQTISGREAAVL